MIRSLSNLGNPANYDFCAAIATMATLEQTRTKRSQILILKSFRLEGPNPGGGGGGGGAVMGATPIIFSWG